VISSPATYALACLGVFLMGALRQCQGCLRAALPALAARLAQRLAAAALPAGGGSGSHHLLERPAALPQPPPLPPPALQRTAAYLAADAALLGAALLLAYLNMLVAMAYDFGLLSSLVAGEAAAHARAYAQRQARDRRAMLAAFALLAVTAAFVVAKRVLWTFLGVRLRLLPWPG
jgi:hypothetical protein